MENAELVNIYIQKQKNYIDDLTQKCLILEARVSLLEKTLASKQEVSKQEVSAD